MEFNWYDIDLTNPETWPVPPVEGELKVGDPSRTKAKERGEKSYYDKDGGEWRPHKPDKHHPQGHWDYKPPGNNTEWQNIYVKPEVVIKPTTNDEMKKFHRDQRTYNIKMMFYNMKMKSYERKMEKYNQELEEYKEKMEEYKEDKKEWSKNNPYYT